MGRAQDQTTPGPHPRQQEILRIAKEVRKQIVMLPQYGVFDNIHFAIKGTDTVVLQGKASRPILKSSAENVVKKVEGVTTVDNQIQVLPVSPNDDRIRTAVYASIYSYLHWRNTRPIKADREAADRLPAPQAESPTILPVAITRFTSLLENGNVTLTGAVNNEGDLAIAGMRANIVPGVFSVDNDLQVANQGK
jgi:hypothetical protein